LIGYYPEYFEQATESLVEDAQAGDHPSLASDTEAAERHDAVGVDADIPSNPYPAPFINADRVEAIFSEDATSLITVAPETNALPDRADLELEPDDDIVGLFLPREQDVVLPVDAIAAYAPWHLYGDAWGIYVSEPLLTGFAAALAELTRAPLERLAPLALRQILEHEWTHFAFEVTGTEIEDVLGRFLYSGYVRYRFGMPEPTWSDGPLEEIVASWSEVSFAANHSGPFRKLRPRGYTAAVRQLLDRSPPGYRDWELMSDWDTAAAIVAAVVSLVANQDLHTYRWARTDVRENLQVPVYWIGSLASAAVFGGVQKTAASPTIRRLRKWLRLIGAIELRSRGKGSHERWQLVSGARVGFGTSSGVLLPPEARQLADALGVRQTVLFELVARMEPVAAHMLG
jgi:hypothetical protein